MRIAIIDTFYDTSHRHWAEGLRDHSGHDISIFYNKARNWKWQMIGGLLDLLPQLNSSDSFDLIIVTDMVNIPLLKSNMEQHHLATPIALYFHENQITYPWSPDDQDKPLQRDHHYGWINYIAATMADMVYFNSSYHLNSFISALPGFLKMFPRFNQPISIDDINNKSMVLPIGIDIPSALQKPSPLPTFLWNHRWEYDKGPDLFFNTLIQLSLEGFQFNLIVLGKSFRVTPPIFAEARQKLDHHILHWGWTSNKNIYRALLQQANILLVTSVQDFFGISIIEAIAAGCYPIMPNRLTYPEHIPSSMYNEILYNTDEDLLPTLREFLKQKIPKDTVALRHHIQKYSWSHLMTQYDRAWEAVRYIEPS